MSQDYEPPPNAVAIIGMAGRFPGARSVDELWENLKDGVESLVELSEDALRAAGVPDDELSDPAYVRAAAPLAEPGRFDAGLFGIHPRDAALMDPQHRHFLECAWAVLEAAGYDPANYPGRIGIVGGVARNTYHLEILANDPELLLEAGEYPLMIAGEKDSAVTRAAYKLGLRGPALNIQTACSTSGVAVHVASRSLLTGECDIAVAGGGRVLVPHGVGYRYEDGGILSPDGHCRAFDADGAGTVRGSGMCFLALKRLEDALEEGDTIHAVILGSATNNDGPDRVGFTAPSIRGQSEVIEEALAVAGVSADSIGYVEAHGTGTAVGDPIEVAALTRAFRGSTDRTGFCGLGSIKTNIGHLDAGAGVAGLIKAALALRDGVQPPSLHFQSPNPEIDFERSPFRVVAELTPWSREDGAPRRAGVSSFGLGGTNVHIVLEEPPPAPVPAEVRGWQLLVLSARSAGALDRLARSTAQALEGSGAPSLDDASYTLQVGRKRFAHRRAVVCRDRDEAVRLLGSSEPHPGVVNEESREEDASPAFLFPGIGSQHARMGRDLYTAEPIFRESMDAALGCFDAEVAGELRELLFGERVADQSAGAKLERPGLGFPATFATSYAVSRLLASWGVEPRAVLGHSVGEYAAACLAGVFDLRDAAALVSFRARIFERLPPGGMLSVSLPGAELLELAPEGISLAVENLPDHSVASGANEPLQELARRLERREIEFRKLHVSTAAHSELLDPFLDEFRSFVETIALEPARTPYLSNLTGDWIEGGEVARAEYWVRHLRETVRFSSALGRLLEGRRYVLVEVGPGQALTGLARMHPKRDPTQPVIPTMRHPRSDEDDQAVLLRAAGRLWASGAHLDWEGFQRVRRRRVPLPTYPFEGEHYWLEPRTKRRRAATAPEGADPADVVRRTPETEPRSPRRGPAPAAAAAAREGPANAEERALSTVREVLSGLSGMAPEALAPDATFLESGFESLSLTQATIILKKDLGVELSFRDLMETYPTPRALARHLTEAADGKYGAVEVASGRNGGTEPTPTTNGTEEGGEVPEVTDEVRHGPWRAPSTGAVEGLDERRRGHLEALVRRLNQRTAGSKRLTEQNRPHLADPRSVEGFRRAWKEATYPIVVDRSSGSRLWDVDGNEWVDVAMGFGSVLLGHNPPFIRDAVVERIQRGVEIGPQTALAGEVARLVCELTGVERAAFCNTGSEAVLAGIRTARTVTGRERIAMFSGSYHGIFDQVLGRGLRAGGKERVIPVAPGIQPKAVEDLLVLDYGDPASLERIREHAHELAAVLVEPVQSRHPDLQPRAFVQDLRSLTRELDVPLLLDEMITGFRSHPGGIQALWNVDADIVTYGKVAGGGFPIGIVAGKARYMDALDGGPWSYGDDSVPEAGVTWFAGTFVRHPVALAAARAILTHLRDEGPELQRRLNERSHRFVAELNDHFEKIGAPIHLEHFSSLFRPSFRSHGEWSPVFHHHLRDRRVHITEGRGGFLSTAHTDEDVSFLLDAFKESAVAMQEGGFFPARGAGDPGGPVRKVREIVPLTAAQEEIWLATRLGDAASCAFNLPVQLRLHGSLDEEALREAFRRLVLRHDALRAVFFPDGSGQRIRDEARPELELVELSDLPETERERRIRDLERMEGESAFDLEEGPAIRARLVRLAREDHLLMLTSHHLVCDGWSLGVLTRELGELYSAVSGRREPELPPPPLYDDYVRGEEEARGGERGEEVEAYWLEEFSDEPSVLDLPTDRPRERERNLRAGTETLHLDPELYGAVKKAAARLGSTPFAFLLAGLETLFHRLTGQERFVIGVTAAGQSLQGEENLVGHCVNLLPLPARIGDGTTFSDHVADARGRLLDAFEHQPYTLGTLLKRLRISRDPGRPLLVSAIFNLEGAGAAPEFRGLGVEVRSGPRAYTNSDLFIDAKPLPAGGLRIDAKYAAALFDPDTIARWLRCYHRLLREAALEPERPLALLPMLPESEERAILGEWTDTAADLGPPTTLPALVREAAERFPEGSAIEWEDEALDRRALQDRVQRLAHRLREEGVERGSRVAVLLPRSPDMVVGLLAILEAGGAYVPLDPDFPPSRLAYMLDDSGAALVLSTSELFDLLPGHDEAAETARPLLLDEEGDDLAGRPAEPLPADDERAPRPDDPAYAIYTSGSTGRPKGVLVPHRAVVNFLRSMAEAPGLAPGERLLAVTTLSFDISVLELFLPLVTGATVVLTDRETASDGRSLRHLLADRHISTLQGTPATWRLLIDSGWDGEPRLRTLTGGEALPPELARELLERASEVWNLYGPTEATVWCTRHRLGDAGQPILIGRPLENTRAYVLGPGEMPVPVGVTGELWVGGEQVALGYLDRPELTAERFRPDPFAENDGARMYRTGDLARWRPDGTLECLGRTDHQVKVRGFRIELGEVEAALDHLEEVRRAVAGVHGEGASERRLVAWVEYHPGQELLASEVRASLRDRLPEYMVPSLVVEVEEMPLTPNGKIDRKRLPDPVPSAAPADRFVEPSTPTERTVAEIWKEALDVPRVGARDNFFDLGGHSLLAMRTLVEMEERTGCRFEPRDMILGTVEQLAARADAQRGNGTGGAG